MSKTPICSLELMSRSDLSRISHRPGAISQVFGLLPLFFALPRLSCGHTDTLSDYSRSSFWHSLLCLQNQPLNWHDTSQFFSFVPKRGSLGGEAKGAAGVCFFQLVLVCSLSLTNSPPTWVLPGAVVSPFRGWWGGLWCGSGEHGQDAHHVLRDVGSSWDPRERVLGIEWRKMKWTQQILWRKRKLLLSGLSCF